MWQKDIQDDGDVSTINVHLNIKNNIQFIVAVKYVFINISI